MSLYFEVFRSAIFISRTPLNRSTKGFKWLEVFIDEDGLDVFIGYTRIEVSSKTVSGLPA